MKVKKGNTPLWVRSMGGYSYTLFLVKQNRLRGKNLKKIENVKKVKIVEEVVLKEVSKKYIDFILEKKEPLTLKQYTIKSNLKLISDVNTIRI